MKCFQRYHIVLVNNYKGYTSLSNTGVSDDMIYFSVLRTQKLKIKGESTIKLEVTVAEAKELINQIQSKSEELFETIRINIRENVGRYLT